jgi:hypothetical protein
MVIGVVTICQFCCLIADNHGIGVSISVVTSIDNITRLLASSRPLFIGIIVDNTNDHGIGVIIAIVFGVVVAAVDDRGIGVIVVTSIDNGTQSLASLLPPFVSFDITTIDGRRIGVVVVTSVDNIAQLLASLLQPPLMTRASELSLSPTSTTLRSH